MSEPIEILRLSAATLEQGVADLCRCDPDLKAVVERYGPPPLWLRQPGFASLVRMILEQQVSLVSARAAYKRLQQVVGRVTPNRVLAVTPMRLREAGITRQKVRYCQELASQLVSGSLALGSLAQLSNQDVCARLIELPGIGQWTADVYLLMALGRVDVWPWGDVALATAVWRLKRLDQRPDYQQLEELARAWASWRSVAARVMWHFYLRAGNHAPRSRRPRKTWSF